MTTGGGGTPLLGSCGGGSFRSGIQSPTGSREGGLPDLELGEGIWRGWIVPVGGSTPDRLKAGSREGGFRIWSWERVFGGGGSFRSGV